jgi:hypothetical protein
MTIWTGDLLDALRQIGDPDLDAGSQPRDFTRVAALGQKAGIHDRLLKWRLADTGAFPGAAQAERDEFWTTPGRKIDPEQLEIAHGLFVSFGGEIGATLLLASLPNAYAAEAGAAVLTQTRELQSHTRRRIGETAQFVVEVLFPDAPSNALYGPRRDELPDDEALPIGMRGYVRVRTTRLTHAAVRSLVSGDRWNPQADAGVPACLGTKVGVVINQEDLLGTLGTFTVTVFDVMEKLGVPWTDEAEAAYLAVWDTVGELLGVGTPEVVAALPDDIREKLPDEYRAALRPKTPAEARELMEIIRLRNWPLPMPGKDLGPFANPNGRMLVRALLDELQASMPRGMERVPLFVMRYLIDPRAHELLGLGAGGLLDSLMHLPRQRQLTRVPMRNLGRGAVEATMRLAANDISRRSFVHFMRESREEEDQTSKFWFPVVETPTVPQGRTPTNGAPNL